MMCGGGDGVCEIEGVFCVCLGEFQYEVVDEFWYGGVIEDVFGYDVICGDYWDVLFVCDV